MIVSLTQLERFIDTIGPLATPTEGDEDIEAERVSMGAAMGLGPSDLPTDEEVRRSLTYRRSIATPPEAPDD